MTVTSSNNKAGPYVTNGVTTQFSFPYRVLQASDIKVYQVDVATNLESLLTTGYTTSLVNGGADGAIVTFTTAPAGGYTITLLREVNYLQDDYDPTAGSTFYADVVEGAIDKRVMQIQQLKEKLDRCVSLPVSAYNYSTTMPLPSAGKLLAWDSAGTSLTLVSPTDIAVIADAGSTTVDAFTSGTNFTPGVTTQLVLSRDPGSKNNANVFFNGVHQHRSTFSVSGTTLTFTSPIPVGVTDVEIAVAELHPQSVPSDGTVTAAKLVAGSVTYDKLNLTYAGPGSSTVLNPATTGATYNGTVLQIDMGATTGSDPYLMRVRYAGNSLLEMRGVRSTDSDGVYAYTWNSDANYTGSVGTITKGGRVHMSRCRLKIPTGCTNNGEWVGRFDEVVRNNQYTGDGGTMNSLRAYNISLGHDNLDASTPTTSQVHGVYVKIKSLSGTITDSYAFRAFHEYGAGTITNNWGFYCDSPTMNNCFEGKTIFGAHSTPTETVDVQSGNVRVLGTSGNTLKIANQVNNGSSTVTISNVGPSLVSPTIQGWLRLNVGGVDSYVPYWR